MKAIIAATDFSAPATNAIHFAAALAKATGAPLVLYHHFDYPVQGTDLPSVIPLYVDELAIDLIHRLEEIKAGLVRAYGIDIECVVRSSSLLGELKIIFADQDAGLIVVGSRGANPVAGALFGSVTTALIRQGEMPVLVVPIEAGFHPLQKILFAYDYEIVDPVVLQPLQELAGAFDAAVELLHLINAESSFGGNPLWKQAYTGRQTAEILRDVPHSHVFANARVATTGILEEAATSGADLVAMIPHHHSWLSNLLNLSTTQQVAAELTLPLLVLGEKVAEAQETTGTMESRG